MAYIITSKEAQYPGLTFPVVQGIQTLEEALKELQTLLEEQVRFHSFSKLMLSEETDVPSFAELTSLFEIDFENL